MKDLETIRSATIRGDLDLARSTLEPLIRSAPDSTTVDYLLALGSASEEIGEMNWATTAYNLVLRSEIGNPDALGRLASIAEEGAQLEQAAAHREQLAEIAPQDTKNLLILAGLYHQLEWRSQTERVGTLLDEAGVKLKGPAPWLGPVEREERERAEGDALDLSLVVDPSEADIGRFLALFSGREDIFARQWFNPRKGIAGYSPVEAPLTARQVRQHLFGDITLGVYPIRLDGTCLFFAFDIDLTKAAIDWARRGTEEAASVRSGLDLAVTTTLNRLRALGLNPLVEDSGYKGRHLWVFLEKPERVEILYGLGRMLRPQLEADFPAGISLEFFPKQAKTRGKGLGNLIKLPLGIHRRTGRRAWVLDDQGNPSPRPFEQLADASRLRHTDLMQLVDSLGVVKQFPASVDGPGGATRGEGIVTSDSPAVLPSEPAPFTEADLFGHPVIGHVLGKCDVIAELISRALEHRHLEHDEVVVLQQSLGHMAGGVAAFNYVLGRCPAIEESLRLKSPLRGNPISCPKIRKRIPSVTSTLDCACVFTDAEDHYPTPVLHVRDAPTITIASPGEECAESPEETVRRCLALRSRLVDLKAELAALEEAAARAATAGGGRVNLPEGVAEVEMKDGIRRLVWKPNQQDVQDVDSKGA